MKPHSKKWVIIILALGIVMLFENLYPHVSLADRSICIGFGVDLLEDGDLQLSAQVIHTRGGGKDSKNIYSVLTGTGKTIKDAFEKLNSQVGPIVSYAHTTAILLGKDFLESDISASIKYMLAAEDLQDSIFLIACEDTAQSVLFKQPILLENMSSAIKAVLGHSSQEKGINCVTIKDFYVNYTKIGQCSYIPLIKPQKMNPGDSATLSGDSGTPEQAKYKVDLTWSVINDGKGKNVVLTQQEGYGLSFLTQKLGAGVLFFTSTDGDLRETTIEQSKAKLKANQETNTIDIKMNMRLNMAIATENNRTKDTLTPEQLAQVQKQVEDDIRAFWSVAQNNNIDAMQIGELMYATYGKKWKDLGNPDYLQKYNIGKIEFSISYF